MTRKLFSIGAGLLLTASIAAPAAAQDVCVGTQSIWHGCINPTGGEPIGDCIYVGPPPCVPVSVPTPSMSCGSSFTFELGLNVLGCRF